MSKKKSKRQTQREIRRKKEQQKRILVIGGIIIVALFLIGAFIYPLFTQPEIITVEPGNWPNEDGTALGNPNADVRIDIYEDFKCSACKVFSAEIEPHLVDNEISNGEVYYVFHQYPFLTQRESFLAANASECAAEQNRFWDYKKMIFENLNHVSDEFNEKSLNAFAETLGLDTKKFSDCLKNEKYAEKVNADKEKGDGLGVAGTPSIFVNGKIVKPGYVPTYQDLQIAIQNAK